MKSEEYKKQAQEADNDMQSLGLMIKALREKRSERFLEDWLPILQTIYTVELRKNGSYTIITQDYGTIDYFPKANNLLIRKDNEWKKPALKWMINNLIKE